MRNWLSLRRVTVAVERTPDRIDDAPQQVVTDGDIVGTEARMRRLPPNAPPVGGAARPPRSQLSSGFTPHAVGAADGPEPEPPLIAPPAPRRQISSEDYAVSVSAGATPEQVFARRLAVHVVSAIEDSNARKILVTSPNRGDGKTRFVQLIKPEMPNISTMSYLVLDMSQLVSTDPRMIPDDVLVLVDGPAMLEGDGVLLGRGEGLREGLPLRPPRLPRPGARGVELQPQDRLPRRRPGPH